VGTAINVVIVMTTLLALQAPVDLAELLRQAKGDNQQTRVLALEALAALGSKAAPVAHQLCELVTTPVVREDVFTLSAAIMAVGEIGADSKPCIPVLQRTAQDRRVYSSSQAAALASIWKIRLYDPSPEVRLRAAEQLGQFSPSVIPALRKALQDSDRRVREAADRSIKRLEAIAKSPAA